MRYQELKAARGTLENAIKHVRTSEANLPGLQAQVILTDALKVVKTELKHPERFNLDGTVRRIRFFDSSNGPYRKEAR